MGAAGRDHAREAHASCSLQLSLTLTIALLFGHRYSVEVFGVRSRAFLSCSNAKSESVSWGSIRAPGS